MVGQCLMMMVGQDHGGTMSDDDGGTRSWWDNV